MESRELTRRTRQADFGTELLGQRRVWADTRVGMVHNDDTPVVRDSQAALWNAVRDGLVYSSDLTKGGQLRASVTSSARSNEWEKTVKEATLFGRQKNPSPITRHPLSDVHVNILASELRSEERKRKAVNAALAKIAEGVRDLEIANAQV